MTVSPPFFLPVPAPRHPFSSFPPTHSQHRYKAISFSSSSFSSSSISSTCPLFRHSPSIPTSTTVSHRLRPLMCADAGSASNTSPQDATPPAPNSIPAPKRKRGRPKGSKNRNPSARKPRSRSPSLNDISIDIESLQELANLKAPNGLSNSSEPRDFFQELLPLFAADEVRDLEGDSEDEEQARQILLTAINEISADAHFAPTSKKDKNLRPFKLLDDDGGFEEEVCDECKGDGMVTCSYCKGEGFVDFGEKNKKFYEDFPDDDMVLPARVMGNTYHCPLCGGWTKERCVKCLGVGELNWMKREEEKKENEQKGRGKKNKVSKGSAQPKDPYWYALDIDKILQEEGADRVEYGKDGTIILRAKPRKKGSGRPKKKKAATDTETKLDELVEKSKMFTEIVSTAQKDDGADGTAPVKVKRGRGRPRKVELVEKELTRIAAETVKLNTTTAATSDASKAGLDVNVGVGAQREVPAASKGLKRGRKKGTVAGTGAAVAPKTSSLEVKSRRRKTKDVPSTDFVNTSDYKVSRRLRKVKKSEDDADSSQL